MGKRKKSKTACQSPKDSLILEETETEVQDVPKTKRNRKSQVSDIDGCNMKEKSKKKFHMENGDCGSKKGKKNKSDKNNQNTSSAMVNNESNEDIVTGQSKKKLKQKINKNHLNDDEADVKEEDIDSFCEEISEQENKQYDKWIQLLEAKLQSNKKPS